MSGWQNVSLKSVTSIIGDGLHGTPKYDPDGEYSFINGNNLGDRKIVFSETTKKSSKEEYLKYRKNLSDRTILLSINGTIGNAAFYNNEKVILGKSACYLNVLESVDKHFIYYIIKNKDFQDYIISLAAGTTIKNVSLKLVRDYILKLPSLDEQRAIVAVLGALDDKIEMNKRMNETLEVTAQALFKSWFVDFDPVKAKAEGCKPEGMDDATASLFPSAFIESILGPIPEGWEISQIGKEVEVVGGSTPSTQESAYWEDGRFYWATPKDLSKLKSPILLDTERKITELGVKQISSGQLPIDTVLLSSRAPVGYIALSKVPVSINQGFIAMRCTKKLSPYYVINWTYSALEEIKARATGTTFAEISKSVFRPIKVIVPHESINQRFNNIAHAIYDRIATNERNISSLINTRDLLLPRLISGKLRVGEISETVEAVAS